MAGETLVVPLDARSSRPSALSDGRIRSLGPETNVVFIRDSFVPLRRPRRRARAIASPQDSYAGGVVLLIAQEDGTRAALIVDAIQDQRQVVIKGLQDSYGHVPGIAAATILGDGQVALILDPSTWSQNAAGRTRSASTVDTRSCRMTP